MDERENPGAQSSYGDSYGGFGGFGGFGYDPFGRSGRKTEYEDDDSRYMKAVVNYINSGSYNEALNLLNSIKRRDGMWYYYSAVANSGAGNNITAMEHINAALSFEPNNMRYMQLKRQLESGESWYAGRTETYGFPGSRSRQLFKMVYLLSDMQPLFRRREIFLLCIMIRLTVSMLMRMYIDEFRMKL